MIHFVFKAMSLLPLLNHSTCFQAPRAPQERTDLECDHGTSIRLHVQDGSLRNHDSKNGVGIWFNQNFFDTPDAR
ncbi:hypothetical protein B0H14DRAFT_2703099 [Mycena olivaceomarginata]|nr:hypothetical protein B0H14DRAFT_2703099 [Mycena olivaceomarginata]